MSRVIVVYKTRVCMASASVSSHLPEEVDEVEDEAKQQVLYY